MSSASSLPARERLAILAGLGGVSALAWLYLVRMARDMGGMSMEAMAIQPWSGAYFAAMLAMWAVMMVGMMVVELGEHMDLKNGMV